MTRQPPLGAPSLHLGCARELPTGDCKAPATWHISWFAEKVRSLDWENSLACTEHKDDAYIRWDVGWRHRTSPACAISGSRLYVAETGTDEDGFPITYCLHPFDVECAVAEVEQSLAEPTLVTEAT